MLFCTFQPEDSKRDQGNVTPEDTHKRRKNATKKVIIYNSGWSKL